jgi:methionyl-tRNA synthetase
VSRGRSRKDPSHRARLDATLGNSADVLRVVAALIEPVMPATGGTYPA